MRRRVRAVLALASLTPLTLSAQSPNTDWQRIARAIVDRISPEKGERVLLVGIPGMSDALVEQLRAVLREEGARDLGAFAVTGTAPKTWTTSFTDGVPRDSAIDTYFADVDVAVMLPGATPTHAAYAAL